MWNDEQRTEFLLKAFELVHQNNRAIRERIHTNVRFSVMFFLLTSSFLLTKTDPVSKDLLVLAGVGIALVAILVLIVISRQFDTLKTQHEIQANLERAMLFHTPSAYFADKALFPPSASAEKLQSFTFYSRLRRAYFSIVLITAIYSIVVTVFVEKSIAE